MFFGASLYCGYNAIQSFTNSFNILKNTLQDVVSQESPQDQYLKSVIADEINAIVAENIAEVQADKISQFTPFQRLNTFSGEVNSKSDLLGISKENSQELIIVDILDQETTNILQKVKNFFKRHFAVLVIGYSMSGVLEHGDIVGAKKVSRFTRYNLGDIIVYKQGEVRVIHMIVGTEIVNGKTQYRTKGVNNPDVDTDLVSKKDILGKVILSNKELNKMLTQVEQGKVLIVDAFGMVNIKEDLTAKQEMHEKLIDYIKYYPGPHSRHYQTFLKSLNQEFKKGKYEPSRSLIDRYIKQQPLHPDFKVQNIIRIAEECNIIIDKQGNAETRVIPLELGNDLFGLIHTLLGHWDNEFEGWGPIEDVFDLLDLIMETIATKEGRLNKRGEVIYELDFYDDHGDRQYLGVVYSDVYNNIITAFKYTKYNTAEKLFSSTNYIGEI